MNLENSQLLRFTTAGSVDDGKSTLIGRLLYDSKSIFEDQLDAVEKTSIRKGHAGVDLALFTDGLRDEREQGITMMWLIVISQHQRESLSLPIHLDIFSTPETWLLEPQQRMQQSYY